MFSPACALPGWKPPVSPLSSPLPPPCLNPEHSIPKGSGSSIRLGAVTSPQQLGMSQPTCNQLPTTTQQMRPAPPTAFLFLLTPLRSSLMANPPSLLCQELCSPNSHFPSSSPAPSHKPICAWQWEASVHLSADRFTGRSCTGQSGLVFSIFLFDSRKHRSPSTLALYFQNARCYSAFYSHHWTAHSES